MYMLREKLSWTIRGLLLSVFSRGCRARVDQAVAERWVRWHVGFGLTSLCFRRRCGELLKESIAVDVMMDASPIFCREILRVRKTILQCSACRRCSSTGCYPRFLCGGPCANGEEGRGGGRD